jgi:SAM-dependent methyltransferase
MHRPELEPDHVAVSREVYDHSVQQYLEAVGTTVSPDFEAPIDLAVLAAFAQDVVSKSAGPVVDAGCGPGRVTRFLADAGLDIRGIDSSPRMIEAARSAHPHLQFDVGSLTNLDISNRSLAGVVYWYSIIATPPDDLRAVWQELDRVLTGTGRMLVAFQSGENELVERADAYGSGSTLKLYRHRVDDVVDSLNGTGFSVHVDVRRTAVFSHETTPQAILVALRQ